MTSYFNDLKLFFQRAGAFPNNRVVLHVEPDMWGYIQQRASNDTASTVPVKVVEHWPVGAERACPTTCAGLRQAIVRLRDTLRPQRRAWRITSVSGALATTFS